jgi:hypothetical protein
MKLKKHKHSHQKRHLYEYFYKKMTQQYWLYAPF